MLGYKVYFNKKTKKWTSDTNLTEVKNIFNVDHVWFNDFESAKECERKRNSYLVRNLEDVRQTTDEEDYRNIHQVRICKDCKSPFIIYLDEYIWLTDRKMVVPKRCKQCRYENKMKKVRN